MKKLVVFVVFGLLVSCGSEIPEIELAADAGDAGVAVAADAGAGVAVDAGTSCKNKHKPKCKGDECD